MNLNINDAKDFLCLFHLEHFHRVFLAQSLFFFSFLPAHSSREVFSDIPQKQILNHFSETYSIFHNKQNGGIADSGQRRQTGWF